jgi:hypothetical protein
MKTMHEAERYLRENRGTRLYVRYGGEKRGLFIAPNDEICMVNKGSRMWGSVFFDWEGITKIYFSDFETERETGKKQY